MQLTYVKLFVLVYPRHILVSPSSTENNALQLTTQKFTGLTDKNNPILVGTYYLNGTYQNYTDLYYDKFQNLEGRIINISALTYVPYSITKTVVNKSFAITNLIRDTDLIQRLACWNRRL